MYKKVVVLGGGTGMSYLLRGLKDFPIDITAIIAVSDDGKSTGKLRKEFRQPAVGDIRKVITNLSDTDDYIKKLMEYRFNTSSDLNGHAMGNLLLTGLMNMTGSLTKSIEELSTLLNVRHKILPLSEDSGLTLVAKTKDDKLIVGEENITNAKKPIVDLFYQEEPVISDEVINAIVDADLIILSMGSLYTSILPNIISKQIRQSLNHAKAPIMYMCNAVTQPGETDEFSVADHVELINDYLDERTIDVVIASNTHIDDETTRKYATEEQKDLVIIDYPRMKTLDTELIEADLLEIENNVIRHNSMKVSSLIMNYLMR